MWKKFVWWLFIKFCSDDLDVILNDHYNMGFQDGFNSVSVSSESVTIPQSDWENFRKTDQILKEQNIKPLPLVCPHK